MVWNFGGWETFDWECWGLLSKWRDGIFREQVEAVALETVGRYGYEIIPTGTYSSLYIDVFPVQEGDDFEVAFFVNAPLSEMAGTWIEYHKFQCFKMEITYRGLENAVL